MNLFLHVTVLDLYKNPDAVELLKEVYKEAASTCQRDGVVQLEHAHQLWQSLFILSDECPSCTAAIPTWFREYLQKQWSIEKSRPKISSARHISISKTLNLMGVAHYNEHDEDIDVAIVPFNPDFEWPLNLMVRITLLGSEVPHQELKQNHHELLVIPS
jgi:hypothetical protein